MAEVIWLTSEVREYFPWESLRLQYVSHFLYFFFLFESLTSPSVFFLPSSTELCDWLDSPFLTRCAPEGLPHTCPLGWVSLAMGTHAWRGALKGHGGAL